MNSLQVIKPCPFCGGEPMLQIHEPHTHVFSGLEALTKEPVVWMHKEHKFIVLNYTPGIGVRHDYMPLYAAPPAPADDVKRDAARYRALRDSGAYCPVGIQSHPWGLALSRVWSTEELDAAIDAAMAEGRGE